MLSLVHANIEQDSRKCDGFTVAPPRMKPAEPLTSRHYLDKAFDRLHVRLHVTFGRKAVARLHMSSAKSLPTCWHALIASAAERLMAHLEETHQ